MMKQSAQEVTGVFGITRRRWLSVPIAGTALAALFNRKAIAHKFYFSTTLVEFNPATQSFEITLRLFADDLEEVLRERAKRKVEIDRTSDAEELTFGYLRDVIRLRGPNMQLLSLSWIGLEAKVDSVYCYLEAAAPPTGLDDLALSHTLFFELQRGQTNIVTFRQPGARKPRDLVFRVGDRFKVVIFPSGETGDAAATESPIPRL